MSYVYMCVSLRASDACCTAHALVDETHAEKRACFPKKQYCILSQSHAAQQAVLKLWIFVRQTVLHKFLFTVLFSVSPVKYITAMFSDKVTFDL